MSMERWDPFRDMLSLREAMDRLFQESFVRPTSAMLSAARGTIPVDVTESGDSYAVYATIPGIKPENVEITIDNNVLTMRGETTSEEQRKEQNYIMHERHSASFSRSITLPGPVDAEHAQARYEHGVLTLTLPKTAAAQPRQIPVSRAQGQPAAQPTDTRAAAQPAAPAAQPAQPGVSGEAPAPSDRVDEASAGSFPASDAPSWPSADI